MVVALDAASLYYYKSGILGKSCSKNLPNHAVVLVGYGTEKGVDFWRIKNSWGTDWGEGGFFRIARNINACNILTYGNYYITE